MTSTGLIRRIILVSIDNLRFDCVGYQPDKRELIRHYALPELQTPILDGLAERAVCLTRCISTNTYTTAAHASLLTGLYPPRHGVRAFLQTRLTDAVFTLPEILQVSGYATLLSSDVPELFSRTGLDRGFHQSIPRDDPGVLAWLEAQRDHPAFALWHVFDVHEPYLLTESPEGPEDNDDYFATMASLYADHHLPWPGTRTQPHSLWHNLFQQTRSRTFRDYLPLYARGVTKFDQGRLRRFIESLTQRRLLDDTLLVILSGHGEGSVWDSSGDFLGHAGNLYDNVLRVPCMLIHPDLPPTIHDGLYSLADLFRTILALALGCDPGTFLPYPLDAVNTLTGRRDRVYAETWSLPRGMRLEEDGEGRPVIPTVDSPSILVQRALRGEAEKTILYGMPEVFLGEPVFELPEEAFVQTLYRCLLGRVEEAHELEAELREMGSKYLTRRVLKQAWLKRFRTRPEFRYQEMDHCVRYRLTGDPSERHPITVQVHDLVQVDDPSVARDISAILALEQQAVTTGALSSKESEKGLDRSPAIRKALVARQRASGCAPAIKRVFLLSIDNLRYDCVGYQPDRTRLRQYDLDRALRTPTLDRLAERAICFTQCVSTNTYTTASHASLFTGLYPPRHGVRQISHATLRGEVWTLAEIFRAAGYRTAMTTDVLELFEPPRLTGGFEKVFHLDDAGLLNFLQVHRDQPLFAFAHFFDVHEPYCWAEYECQSGYNQGYFEVMRELYGRCGVVWRDRRAHEIWYDLFRPEQGWRRTELMLPIYVKGVTRFDTGRLAHFLGRLEQMGLLDGSLLIVFSDHGEGRVSDGYYYAGNEFGHAGLLYDDVLRVPIMLAHQDLPHRMVTQLTSTVDILPTVLDLALGVDPKQVLPYRVDGMSLLAGERHEAYAEAWNLPRTVALTVDEISGKVGPERLEVVQADYLLLQRCLRTADRKYVLYGAPETLTASEIDRLDDEAFVRAIYRLLCARPETEAEVMNHCRSLSQWGADRGEQRTGLLEAFRESMERDRLRCAIYNLATDPMESLPSSIASQDLVQVDDPDVQAALDRMVTIGRGLTVPPLGDEPVMRREAVEEGPDPANNGEEM